MGRTQEFAIAVSKEGISFTAESIDVLRHYVEWATNNKAFVYLAGGTDEQGNIAVHIAGDQKIRSTAIADQLADVRFYWQINPTKFDLIRMTYCLDAQQEKKIRLIPLITGASGKS